MIRIDRSRVAEPEVLKRGPGSLAQQDFQQALVHYSNPGSRQLGPFKFRAYRHETVISALRQLFHSKCAYCETPLRPREGDVEMFRPKDGVITGQGQYLHEHYWWLANSWTNLYLACAECNRVSDRSGTRSGKGGRFPLEDESQRAPRLAGPDELALERPLLLDPCSDNVESLLVYSDDGTVSSTTPKGQITIELLDLNRAKLVSERQEKVLLIKKTFDALDDEDRLGTYNRRLADDLQRMVSDSAPYAGICRQYVRSEARLRTFDDLIRFDGDLAPVRSQAEQRQAKAAQTAFQQAQESYSLEDATPEAFAAYANVRDRRVEHIHVRNLRAISSLSIPIKTRSGDAPWLMLLGENSSGKSTVLQALALALVGDSYFDPASGIVDRGRLVRFGKEFGEISVKLTGATEPRIVRIHADGRIEYSGRSGQLMVLGYGSTRLLPRKGSGGHLGREYARIENLFNPFIPLVDAQKWLLEADEDDFDHASRALKKALNISPDRLLIRQDGDVGLVENGTFIPLQQLCDGYQTTIALIADILEIVMRSWRTPELAQGVVLIDEVGNHLHPAWKMRFVSSMREIMPGVQFIATTHEPLCLRGLRDGEVAVLRRGPRGGISMRTDLPSIEGLRVDQILTSEHFGLESTLDPKLQALFDRYHALLRSASPTPAELAERESLRKQIDEVQDLGRTERERRLLTAIDQFLAEKPELETFDEVDEREQQLEAELASIWQDSARQIR